jgi:hypothetical protein
MNGKKWMDNVVSQLYPDLNPRNNISCARFFCLSGGISVNVRQHRSKLTNPTQKKGARNVYDMFIIINGCIPNATQEVP